MIGEPSTAMPAIQSGPPEQDFDEYRVTVLRAHGATEENEGELLAYTARAFQRPTGTGPVAYADESFVAVWEEYAEEARRIGAWAVLRDRLPQLGFPIRRGISESTEYRAATRRGEYQGAQGAPGLELDAPDLLQLRIHATPAGRIPVLVTAVRADFVRLVQALTRRNEPEDIPEAMGACIVTGYNNWDRVRRLRRVWEATNPEGHEDWTDELRRLAPRKELYQDRFILLSRDAYSATPASAVGLSESKWLEASLIIRLEHECAHYYTHRVFGSMRNSLHDEIVADYAGIVAATDRYRSDWFLRFMGLEAFPTFRTGSRLELYRGTPALSDGAFRVLQALLYSIARNIEKADAAVGCGSRSPAQRAVACDTLIRLCIEEMADPVAEIDLTGHMGTDKAPRDRIHSA